MVGDTVRRTRCPKPDRPKSTRANPLDDQPLDSWIGEVVLGSVFDVERINNTEPTFMEGPRQTPNAAEELERKSASCNAGKTLCGPKLPDCPSSNAGKESLATPRSNGFTRSKKTMLSDARGTI
jgi:hypothetical protein